MVCRGEALAYQKRGRKHALLGLTAMKYGFLRSSAHAAATAAAAAAAAAARQGKRDKYR